MITYLRKGLLSSQKPNILLPQILLILYSAGDKEIFCDSGAFHFDGTNRRLMRFAHKSALPFFRPSGAAEDSRQKAVGRGQKTETGQGREPKDEV
jgi:hypothetical protein